MPQWENCDSLYYLASHLEGWLLLWVPRGGRLSLCPAALGLTDEKEWRSSRGSHIGPQPLFILKCKHEIKAVHEKRKWKKTFLDHLSRLWFGKFNEQAAEANLHLICGWQQRPLSQPTRHCRITTRIVSPNCAHVNGWSHRSQKTTFLFSDNLLSQSIGSPVSDISFFSAFNASLLLFLLVSRSTIWNIHTHVRQVRLSSWRVNTMRNLFKN